MDGLCMYTTGAAEPIKSGTATGAIPVDGGSCLPYTAQWSVSEFAYRTITGASMITVKNCPRDGALKCKFMFYMCTCRA